MFFNREHEPSCPAVHRQVRLISEMRSIRLACDVRSYAGAYVSIRQHMQRHTSAYVSSAAISDSLVTSVFF